MAKIGKYAAWFCALIFLFCALMTLVFCIPDEKIEWHREYSICALRIEESWESFGNLFGLHSQPGMLDNTTDRVMLLCTEGNGQASPWKTALDISGYTRYWHGYLVFLRPLLLFYQLHQIRYLNLFLFFGLLFAVLSAMRRRLGLPAAIAFFLSITCAGLTTIPSSMQFMACFVVMFIAMLIVLWRYPFHKEENVPLFYMVIGMTINFLDFLTVPLITLGVPLLIMLYLDAENMQKEKKFFCLWRVFSCSLAFGVGYSLCWAAKWMIGYLVLRNDVMEQVFSHAQFWTKGVAEEVTTPMQAIALNFSDFFTKHGLRTMIIPLLPLVPVWAAAIRYLSKEKLGSAACMLVVCLFPYLWYAVMKQHSVEHHWFVYRAQVITLLGAYFAALRLMNGDALRLSGAWRMLKRDRHA